MIKTILTIDDSASIRQMVSFTLKSAGYGVIEAADGSDGLHKIAMQSISLVLTDQNMPGMDGISVIRCIRQLPQHAHTPILVLSTESSEDLKLRARQAGANGWLVKPFDPMQLIQIVRRLIG